MGREYGNVGDLEEAAAIADATTTGPQPEVPQGLARWFYRVDWVDAPLPGPALVRG